MISRTYLVLMPSNAGATAQVDIPVEGNANWGTVGATSGPVVAVGADGFYVEQRNRRLRIPIKAGNTGFVPRLRLGFSLSVQQVGGTGAANLLAIQLSQSLVGNVFSNAAGATVTGDANLPDPSGVPVIRLLNTAAVQGLQFRIFLNVMTPEDDDPSGE